MRYRGRRWNNILILSVILFIAVINLPTLIKTYLLQPDEVVESYPTLLDTRHPLMAIYSRDWSLNYYNGDWQSTPELSLPVLELVQRWKGLSGTAVSAEMFQSLKPTLSTPRSIEIWYDGVEEPQRITYYQTPQFWLFKNWQDQWIAVSVEQFYLFPQLDREK